MIERYSRPKMAAIWSEEAKYQTWLDVEILACEGWDKLGKLPKGALASIKAKAAFEVEAILKKEEITKHDVAAFVSVVQENIGDAGKFFHYGLTSSDILDTALSYRLKKSGEMLDANLEGILKLLQKNALRDKDTPMMGRTHGIHAEPMSMGMKWLLWFDILKRSRERLKAATQAVSVGKLSGAVGHYAHVPPEVEQHVCKSLGLEVDAISTQVVSRDRHAQYFCAIALLASCVEQIAVELRHLQRTEVGEVQEGFTKGQKGSSAMPHKRNPITAENLTGLARLLRSMALPAMENCALWHERDISHSSVERVIGPDANILADYMLGRLEKLLEGLIVDKQRMQRNLDMLQGVAYSQKVLLSLIDAGLTRDQAYEIVQKNSHIAIDRGQPLRELLKKDADVLKVLSTQQLDVLFEPRTYLKHLDYLFKKVLENDHPSHP